ncbi:maleylpyruvate isomerase N-terminal domain-containing protein [Nonomuraea sp. NPDC049695]|uniref:maleylpyruvate isomerase N-terminal domain-containing protein n=1 Tax=Nonomuraea sp. NPDC049695 TaxID=3154734 RepID=UPI00344265C6
MCEQTLASAAGVALLERAIDYAVGSLRIVTTAALCRATPCADWNLQRLLDHLADSLQTLNDAATGHVLPPPSRIGHVFPPPVDEVSRGACHNPALHLRDGATEVLALWTGTLASNRTAGTPPGNELIAIAGHHLTSPVVAAVGAIEIAVHGWDVARSCGEHRPIPSLMADELLDLAQLFVTGDDRPHRFAPRVTVSPHAPAEDRLLAYLGRDPN